MNYYSDGVNYDANENNANNYIIDNSKTIANEYFKYYTKIIGGMSVNNNTLDTEVVVPLKYLSNF